MFTLKVVLIIDYRHHIGIFKVTVGSTRDYKIHIHVFAEIFVNEPYTWIYLFPQPYKTGGNPPSAQELPNGRFKPIKVAAYNLKCIRKFFK